VVGVVVTAGAAPPVGFAMTTADHLPHLFVRLPLTCPGAVSPANQ
jgi:hypothetical protein